MPVKKLTTTASYNTFKVKSLLVPKNVSEFNIYKTVSFWQKTKQYEPLTHHIVMWKYELECLKVIY